MLARLTVATMGVLATLLATSLRPSPAQAAEGGYHYAALGADSFCNPSTSAMNAYFSGTSYYWWGVYIGGGNRGCSTGPSASWIKTAMGQGWALEPIWVGPQSKCVNQGGLSHFSNDTTKAFNRGESAASNAYNEAKSLGLNLTNSANPVPIVYDMEGFDTSNGTCLAAVKAFMRGWDTILAITPAQKPGYYGSAASSDPTAIWGISPKPAFLWGAKADGAQNLSMTPYVSASIWPHRLKQFGSGTASSGSYSVAIDKDCADGPVYAVAKVSTGQCS